MFLEEKNLTLFIKASADFMEPAHHTNCNNKISDIWVWWHNVFLNIFYSFLKSSTAWFLIRSNSRGWYIEPFRAGMILWPAGPRTLLNQMPADRNWSETSLCKLFARMSLSFKRDLLECLNLVKYWTMNVSWLNHVTVRPVLWFERKSVS